MTDLTEILLDLADGQVDFILVGGLAAASQGASLTTVDVDIVHERGAANVARLLVVLDRLAARYRSRADLRPTPEALAGPGHQLLATSKGFLDVLGAIEEGQGYAELLPHAMMVDIDGRSIRVLRLEKLLELKRHWTDDESRLRAEVLARALEGKGKGREPG